MIGKVLKRGHRPANLLWYLYSPGRANEHINPRLVAGWRHPAELEPPLKPDGQRDFRQLTGLMRMPLALLGGRAPKEYVYHVAVRAAPCDPVLGDGAWMAIAAEIMHRLGLSERGHEDQGVPWVALHHGDNHIHIVAVLARLDGRRARLDNDYKTIGEVLREVEAEYGLRVLDRPDRTAAVRPTRAETEKAAKAGRPEPPRVTLRRHVAAAAAAARSEADFLAALEQRGVKVRLRYSTRDAGTVTGYAVGLPGDLTAGGDLIWYGGRRLAPDLSLPALRRRWTRSGPRPGPASVRPLPGPPTHGRLSGAAMAGGPARAVLRREVARCAAAARSDREFFTRLQQAGLIVRLRYDPARLARPAGYSVSLPGMIHKDGHQVWYGGKTLHKNLSLPVLRSRWQSGQPGAGPGAELFDGVEVSDIYRYVSAAAGEAARQLRNVRGDHAADIAWAAADLLAAAADATGSPELQRAADGFARAGRARWGRVPSPSPAGLMLRTAAYLLAACGPGGWQRRVARIALRTALTSLARSVAGLRDQQQRLLQAAAAREASAGLAAIPLPEWNPPVPARVTGRPAGKGKAPRPAARSRPAPGLAGRTPQGP